MQALAAGGFGEGDEAQLFQPFLHLFGGGDDFLKAQSFGRVEVEDKACRLFRASSVLTEMRCGQTLGTMDSKSELSPS